MKSLIVILQQVAKHGADGLRAYTAKVKEQMTLGDYHSVPQSVDAFGMEGVMEKIQGADGIIRTKVSISGKYMGESGVFEYIIEPDGITCNHRLFVPD